MILIKLFNKYKASAAEKQATADGIKIISVGAGTILCRQNHDFDLIFLIDLIAGR